MIKSLNHIAIAVPELDSAISRFVDDLGLTLSGTEDVEAATTATAFLPVSGPTTIELVAPLRGEGPIAGFLAKRKPGIHHLCFEVTDVQAAMDKLVAKGYVFTSEAPTDGAHGMKVAFIHPKSTGGVLIELAQMGHA